MIDLHSHILHAIDDGSRSLADAITVARTAVAGGVSLMVATPHGRSSVSAGSRYSVALLRERLEELQGTLDHAGVPLKLVAGTEIYAEPGALERLHAGELLTYGSSRAILIEFPLAITAHAAEELIFSFQLAGYRVVLAHPERYRFVQRDPNLLIPLIERGTLMQLTADALVGLQGMQMRRLAELLLQHGMIQLIATDAHGPHLARMPNLAAARELVAKLVSDEAATLLTQRVPSAVLTDTPLDIPIPRPVRRWPMGW